MTCLVELYCLSNTSRMAFSLYFGGCNTDSTIDKIHWTSTCIRRNENIHESCEYTEYTLVWSWCGWLYQGCLMMHRPDSKLFQHAFRGPWIHWSANFMEIATSFHGNLQSLSSNFGFYKSPYKNLQLSSSHMLTLKVSRLPLSENLTHQRFKPVGGALDHVTKSKGHGEYTGIYCHHLVMTHGTMPFEPVGISFHHCQGRLKTSRSATWPVSGETTATCKEEICLPIVPNSLEFSQDGPYNCT